MDDLSETVHFRSADIPTYISVRHLLRVWHGRPRKQITGLRHEVKAQGGTPQSPSDWSNPEEWISHRLSGEYRELAEDIWTGSGGEVNPRYTSKQFQLSQQYDLIAEDAQGIMFLTERGKAFLNDMGGQVEVSVDQQEGLLVVLAIVSNHGPTRKATLLQEWGKYLDQVRSTYRSPKTRGNTLRRRLLNLWDRNLISRDGHLYDITSAGRAYLARMGMAVDPLPHPPSDHTQKMKPPTGILHQDLERLVGETQAQVRKGLQELLKGMDPFHFEHLIKHLLEKMGYQNVEVTAPSSDGGGDVIADIEMGLTKVREVVQVKRHQKTIQRKTVDRLRGCLHRFEAVHGTIITTSKFSRPAQKAVEESGSVPITLIDGERLVDLLIEHEIGIRKQFVEVWELHPEGLTAWIEEE